MGLRKLSGTIADLNGFIRTSDRRLKILIKDFTNAQLKELHYALLTRYNGSDMLMTALLNNGVIDKKRNIHSLYLEVETLTYKGMDRKSKTSNKYFLESTIYHEWVMILSYKRYEDIWE